MVIDFLGCGWVMELVVQLGKVFQVQFPHKFWFDSRSLGSWFFVAIYFLAIKSEN
jgi:hypothetical protein